MLPTTTTLSAVQNWLADQLRRAGELRGVAVFTLPAGREPEADVAGARASGVIVEVLYPRPMRASPGATSPFFAGIDLRVRISEPAIGVDASALTAPVLAERISHRLVGLVPPLEAITSSLAMAEEFAWWVLPKAGETGHRSVTLTFTLRGEIG